MLSSISPLLHEPRRSVRKASVDTCRPTHRQTTFQCSLGGAVANLRKSHQLSAVSQNEFAALVAVVRPILTGILNSLKADVVAQWGRQRTAKNARADPPTG
jgi:hypothetical protein